MLFAHAAEEAGIRQLLVPLLGVAYAASMVSVIRLRRQRHRVSLCVLDERSLAAACEALLEEPDAELCAGEDALVGFGVAVDGAVVGLDQLRLDPCGAGGVLEEPRVDSRFDGLGLEELLRRFSLSRAPAGLRLRQMAFAWNERVCRLYTRAGMRESARWGYRIATQRELPALRTAAVAQLEAIGRRRTRAQAGAPSAMAAAAAVRRACGRPQPLLLQYWELHELAALERLCASPRGLALHTAGGAVCSLGELVERAEPLGSLCTATLYAGGLGASGDAAAAEALSLVLFWADEAERRQVRSLVLFLPGALLDTLNLSRQECQLVAFEATPEP
jgi:hypothetical protein